MHYAGTPYFASDLLALSSPKTASYVSSEYSEEEAAEESPRSFTFLRAHSMDTLPSCPPPEGHAERCADECPTWVRGLSSLTWLSHLWKSPPEQSAALAKSREDFKLCQQALEELEESCWALPAAQRWVSTCDACSLPLSEEGLAAQASLVTTAKWLAEMQAQLKEASNAYDLKQTLRRTAMQQQQVPLNRLLSEIRRLRKQV